MASKRKSPIKHVGFEGAARAAAEGEGESMEAGRRMIGYAKAHASKAARKRNPRLNRTSGY